MSLVAEKLSLNCSGVFLLRDVNVSILPGKITTIVGPNGAVKRPYFVAYRTIFHRHLAL